jgi:hypothetical protein
MKVFISYRREDSAGHTGRLYDSLQAHFGADGVFMDLSDIDSGENFVEVIHAAIQSSDVVLAVIGKEWLTCAGPGGRRLDDPNDLVRTEIAAAFERDLPVIPVLVDGTTMPPAAALPAALKPLARRDAHEITDERWAYDVGRLIEATGKRAGKPVARKRHTWRPVAAGLVIVAIAGGVFVWRAREAPATGPEDSVAPTAQASTLQAGHATGAARDDASLPPAALAGEWSAEVTYDWGATHTERFQFKIDGTDVLGTASYLGLPRGILGGTATGGRVLFETRTQVVSGDWNKPADLVHRYRGTITGDAITFYMQSEGGQPALPVEFTARRVSAESP